MKEIVSHEFDSGIRKDAQEGGRVALEQTAHAALSKDLACTLASAISPDISAPLMWL
jgi:hypothetical protein